MDASVTVAKILLVTLRRPPDPVVRRLSVPSPVETAVALSPTKLVVALVASLFSLRHRLPKSLRLFPAT